MAKIKADYEMNPSVMKTPTMAASCFEIVDPEVYNNFYN